MANPSTTITLPGGEIIFGLPVNPTLAGAQVTTWTENKPRRAKELTQDVGAAVYWHRNRPLFVGLASTAVSVPTGSWTPIALTALYDNWKGFNQPAPTGLYYFPSTTTPSTQMDVYLTIAYVPFNSTSASNTFIAGAAIGSQAQIEGTKMSAGGSHNIDCLYVDLSFGNPALGANQYDYAYLVGYQNTGSTITTATAGKTGSLAVMWVATGAGSVVTQPGVPHSWIDQDEITATATGSSSQSPGVKVPLSVEVTRPLSWLQFPPVARLDSETSTQTIPSGTWTSVQFPNQYWDPYSGWSSAHNTRWTVPAGCAGVYLAAGFVDVAESSTTHTGYRAVRLLVNGTTPYGGATITPVTGTSTTGTGLNAFALPRLNAGDYVEVQMMQTQGTSLTVNATASNASRLNMLWMSQ